MKDAWLGWENYIESGKLAALLLAALLFLWFHRKQAEQRLLLYTTVMTFCCIVPVTAVLLMKYQTKFYDYEWVWSMVPLTAVIAYGIAFFLTEYWKDFRGAEWRKGVPVTMLLLAVVLLSGGMGRQVWDKDAQKAEQQQAYKVLEQIAAKSPDGNLCLWAPREIMEYARETNGNIRLPYGRNMWDIYLNGYAYDTYDEKMKMLYQWMEQAGAGEDIPDREKRLGECVQYALDAGVDCILLPPDTNPETVRGMEEKLGIKAAMLEGYWIYYGRAD